MTLEEMRAKYAELEKLKKEALAAGNQELAIKYNDEMYSLSFDIHNASRKEKKEDIDAYKEAKPNIEAAKAIQASSQASKDRQRRLRGSASGTIATSPLGIVGKATTKKKRLLGL
jgi:hypothetical protein